MKTHEIALREWTTNEITFDFGFGVRIFTRQQIEEVTAILRCEDPLPTFTFDREDGSPFYLIKGEVKILEQSAVDVADLVRSGMDKTVLMPRNFMRCETLKEVKGILEKGIPFEE